MSKRTKVLIGVGGLLALVACAVVTIVGMLVFRFWSWGAMPMRQMQTERPMPGTSQMEVRLIDDDGDGIPDRGVIGGTQGQFPMADGGRGRRSMPGSGGGMMPGMGMLRFRRLHRRPSLLRGVLRLGLLAGIVALVVWLVRRHKRRTEVG